MSAIAPDGRYSSVYVRVSVALERTLTPSLPIGVQRPVFKEVQHRSVTVALCCPATRDSKTGLPEHVICMWLRARKRG
jgi:hypothetical protein